MRNFTFYVILGTIICFLNSPVAYSQGPIFPTAPQGNKINTINTAVPFLLIAPDPIGAAMGETGVSSKPDVYSMHWNPAKYAFLHHGSVMRKDLDADSNEYVNFVTKVGATIIPYMRRSAGGNLVYFAVSQKLNHKSALSLAVRYFRHGENQFIDIIGSDLGAFSPKEYSIDLSYSKRIYENLSFGITGRFINSNLTLGQFEGLKTSISFAGDVGIYWQKKVDWFHDTGAEFAWGLNISNVGSKISYSEVNLHKQFIPTNLRLGPRLTLEFDDRKYLTFSMGISKLLVPTPPLYARDEQGNPIPIDGTDKFEIAKGRDSDVSVVAGMLQSFYDAPDGIKEELSEITYAFGVEFLNQKSFVFRAGYHLEFERKGNRKFFTIGAGYEKEKFGINLSFVLPQSSDMSYLSSIYRLGLNLNLFKERDKSKVNAMY